jgi:hypothetical protein
MMGVPQFTARAAVYRSAANYAGAVRTNGDPGSIVPAQCLPPGLCAKASRCCQRGDEGWCCDVLNRCFDCFEF